MNFFFLLDQLPISLWPPASFPNESFGLFQTTPPVSELHDSKAYLRPSPKSMTTNSEALCPFLPSPRHLVSAVSWHFRVPLFKPLHTQLLLNVGTERHFPQARPQRYTTASTQQTSIFAGCLIIQVCMSPGPIVSARLSFTQRHRKTSKKQLTTQKGKKVKYMQTPLPRLSEDSNLAVASLQELTLRRGWAAIKQHTSRGINRAVCLRKLFKVKG